MPSLICRISVISASLLFVTTIWGQSTTVLIRFENGKSGKPLAVKYMKVGGGGYDIDGYRVEKVEKYGLIVTFKDKKTFAFRSEGYYRCDTNVQAAPAMQFSL